MQCCWWWRPTSRSCRRPGKHFDICRLLSIPRGLVVITKCDLVDQEIVELVQLELQDYLRGSFLEGAAVIPFSASSHEGLDPIRQALAELCDALPPSQSGPSLSIADRSMLQLQGIRNGRHRHAGERHDSKGGRSRALSHREAFEGAARPGLFPGGRSSPGRTADGAESARGGSR